MNENGVGNREESWLNGATQLPTPEVRAAFLREACAGDEQLRQRAEALLQAAQPTNRFLNQSAAGAPPSPSPPQEERVGERRSGDPNPPSPTIILSLPIAEKPGDRIGHYKLLEQTGEGGCGVVYMAEQPELIRRLGHRDGAALLLDGTGAGDQDHGLSNCKRIDEWMILLALEFRIVGWKDIKCEMKSEN